ncbi:MAG: response regulator [Bacteroidetes bacterium]|nr:response regulator [Bacteroidota bacterium]MBU1422450.1 response regulator [Bacteroidota bacterium]MBU2636794.1 response regulator [Bacteroidota bacterium]MDI6778829.1 response regulator [Bacteroidota bacterium]
MERAKGEYILIVEDDIEVSSLINDILTSFNYNCVVVEDGKSALEIYNSNEPKFALVLSDLGLSKLGGVELFEQLYKINPQIKFIAMSGFGHQDVGDSLQAKGVKAFISKPFRIENLLKTIKDILDD